MQEGLYREQLRLSQELQSESSRIQEQKTEVRGQLEAAQSSRQSLEEQLQRLQRDNTQLQVSGRLIPAVIQTLLLVVTNPSSHSDLVAGCD